MLKAAVLAVPLDLLVKCQRHGGYMKKYLKIWSIPLFFIIAGSTAEQTQIIVEPAYFAVFGWVCGFFYDMALNDLFYK